MKPSLQRQLLLVVVVLLLLGALSSPAASVSLSHFYLERERTQVHASVNHVPANWTSPAPLPPLLLVGLPPPPW